ncbi:MAG: recombinase family protein [Rhodobacteraceae bacterium]|nr:recombinase family protein [Paracoccaceae bacterium]
MNRQSKISRQHQQKMAYIYIRQSTLRQVAENQESQALQYQLAAHAGRLGWHEGNITVIDEDLGKSGASSQERFGFQRLFTDIGLGKAGILLVTDVSRLARNCADWYQLLDLAAFNHVLICDSGGVYDPRAYDDRLLLGVKGAFSEAQWHVMRQQMQAARLNKAKRGELNFRLPVGYDRLPNDEIVQTPDQQAQAVIHLVFDQFHRLGSTRAVLRMLQADGVQLPRRVRTLTGAWGIEWCVPAYSQVYYFLKLPAYAGAYAYGKRKKRDGMGKIKTRYGGWLPPDGWQVLRQNAFPAYISWEDYMRNQETLAENWQASRFANRDDPVNRGSDNSPFSLRRGAGKGRALLQGLVVCSHCGRQMRVRYSDKPAYVCEATKMQYNHPRCQYVPYAHADHAVVAAFLEVVQPAMLEDVLSSITDSRQQQSQLEKQWQHQLDRAQYEVDLAKARYLEIDPRFRLVAVELERAWETALQAQQEQLREWERVQAEQLHPLSAEEEQLVRRLATDLPALWAAESSSNRDRKRLLRTLIAQVTLDSEQEAGITHLQIRWRTGAVTALTAVRPRPGHPSNPHLLAEVGRLAGTGETDEQVATHLNREGIVSSWHVKDDPAYLLGQPVSYWTAKRVGNLRRKHKIRIDFEAGGFVSSKTAAERIGVSVTVVLDWVRRGLLPGRQQRRGAAVWIPLDEELLYRVSGNAPRDLPWRGGTFPVMVLFSQAGSHFSLSERELTVGLKNGRFLTWRLEHGGHWRWYVQEAACSELVGLGSKQAEVTDFLSENNHESVQPADSISK